MALPHLTLRPQESDDASMLRLWFQDSRCHHAGGDRALDYYLGSGAMLLAVDDRGTPVAALIVEDDDAFEHHLILVVDPSKHRLGYGQATIQALLTKDASAEGREAVLVASIDRGNEASIKCFTAAGFVDDECDEPDTVTLTYVPA